MKKFYSEPTMDAIELESIDVVCTSTPEPGEQAKSLKTRVNENVGVGYGAQSVSIYD